MTKPKIQNKSKLQIPDDKTLCFQCLKFGFWILFVIWNLVFVIFSVAADEKGGAMQPAKNIIIELPSPKLTSSVSLEEAIYKRRSKRSFAQKDLTLNEISQLLWAAQGITDEGMGFRAAPSAGALYPLEVYVVKKDGLFHYIPEGHKLSLISGDDLRTWLSGMAMGQDFIREAPIDIVICAVYSRMASKYGERGARLTDIEVGHVGENIQLEAVSMGLGSCVVGGFEPPEVAAALNLPKGEEPVYIIPVGYTK